MTMYCHFCFSIEIPPDIDTNSAAIYSQKVLLFKWGPRSGTRRILTRRSRRRGGLSRPAGRVRQVQARQLRDRSRRAREDLARAHRGRRPGHGVWIIFFDMQIVYLLMNSHCNISCITNYFLRYYSNCELN